MSGFGMGEAGSPYVLGSPVVHTRGGPGLGRVFEAGSLLEKQTI